MLKTQIVSYSLLLLLLIPHINTMAQARPFGNKFKQSPVYRSVKDSVALKQIENQLSVAYTTLPLNQKRVDSLRVLWNESYTSGVIRYKKTYSASPDFFSYDSLKLKNDKSKVTKISLAIKKLKKLPEDLLQCTNLEELEVINSHLRKIQPQLNALKNLRKITILNNSSSRPLKLGKNTNVTHLSIHGDSPPSIPRSFKKFESLKKIDLSENGMKEFTNGGRHNKKLVELDLQFNEITLKQNNIKPHPNMERLSLQNNKIEFVPASIRNMPNLKKLTFNYNLITDAALEINQLHKLEYISFYNNKLTTIPAGVYAIRSLRYIDLFYNQLTAIDERVVGWPRLRATCWPQVVQT